MTRYASWVNAKEMCGTVSSAYKGIYLRSREAKERGAPSSVFGLTRSSQMDETTRPPQKEAILELGADEDLQQWVVTRINDEITVDLMTEACGVRYQEAMTEVQIREVQSVPIPMANWQLMVKLKQSQRPKDQIDLQFLLQLDDQNEESLR
jgi:hypothetical protein